MEIVDASFLENSTNITALLCDILLENETFYCVDDPPYSSKGRYRKWIFQAVLILAGSKHREKQPDKAFSVGECKINHLLIS